jgi:hypothetical protein
LTTAIIFVPPDHPLDAPFVMGGIAHAARRGYPRPAVCRSWDTVDGLLATGVVETVIVSLSEHGADAPAVRADSAEGDPGLTTVTILANRRDQSGRGHHRAGRRHSNRRAVPPATADQVIADAVRRWKLFTTARRWVRRTPNDT